MAGRGSRGSMVAVGPAFGDFGGVSQHVRSLAKHSAHAPQVFRLPPWSIFHPAWSGPFGWIETRRVRAPDPWVLALARRLASAELVHLHAYPYWIEAYLRRKNPDAAYVVSVHQVFQEIDFPPRAWPRFAALNRNLFDACRTADAVVSVAAWQAKLLEAEGVKPVVIPNGVDVVAAASGDAARFAANYRLHEPFYLTAGALSRYKRPEHVAALADRMPGRAFVAIGKDMTATKVAEYLGRPLPPNLHCLGEVPRRDLLDAYAACRVFLLASVNDTFPTVLLEAMAAGKPVVASRSAGPREIVQEGSSGLLFKPDDVDDFEEAARVGWDAPAGVASAARERAARFAWPRVASELDDLYARLLGGKA